MIEGTTHDFMTTTLCIKSHNWNIFVAKISENKRDVINNNTI